ncbi:flavodoxin family protein [Candidatus Omnitrophota bacterium]
MKVLGVLGSPLRGGNAEIILDKALEGARSSGRDTEKLILNELKFVPCQNCGGCDETGVCIVDDEMQRVYERVAEAEAIILASPIFFGSLSAQTKAMVDRFQSIWVAKEVLGRSRAKKPGYLILVEGSDRQHFFKNAESIVKNLFSVLDIEFTGSLYCPSVDQKAKILEHPEYLDQALAMGKNIQPLN